jgi:hypothetical protein
VHVSDEARRPRMDFVCSSDIFSVATCSLTLTERVLALIDTEIRNKTHKKITSEVTLVVFSTLIK